MTKLNKFLLAMTLLFGTVHLCSASTTIPGTIATSQVWTAANSPYILNKNVTLLSGVTVKVMPGVTIQSAGKFRIMVDGEFIAEGKYDSVIIIDKVNFDFTLKSVGYNFKTDQGSHFNFCLFQGDYGGGNKTIFLDNKSLLISNCKFVDCYYAVYALNGFDTIKIKMVRSIFENTASNWGYPAYISGANTWLEMDQCYVNNVYGIVNPNHIRITRSTFNNWVSSTGLRANYTSFTRPGDFILKCNVFKNFKAGVVEMAGTDTSTKVDIEDNTFDSCEYFISQIYIGDNACRPTVKNNNFLKNLRYAVIFNGKGSAPTTYDLKSNYWNTTDMVKIDSMIYDFNDDGTLPPLVDYSGYLNKSVSLCSEEFLVLKTAQISAFNMYPNPAADYFTIQLKDNGLKTIHIFNMMGDMVFELSSMVNEERLHISGLPNGIYMVEVICETKQARVQKLLINR